MWMYHCNFGWPLLAEGAESGDSQQERYAA